MLDSGITGEVTLRSGPASLLRRVEPVSGTLTLTSAHLRFEPQARFVQGGTLSIPLADIERIELGSTAWVIPDRMTVIRRDGRKHEIAVTDRDGWAALLARTGLRPVTSR